MDNSSEGGLFTLNNNIDTLDNKNKFRKYFINIKFYNNEKYYNENKDNEEDT